MPHVTLNKLGECLLPEVVAALYGDALSTKPGIGTAADPNPINSPRSRAARGQSGGPMNVTSQESPIVSYLVGLDWIRLADLQVMTGQATSGLLRRIVPATPEPERSCGGFQLGRLNRPSGRSAVNGPLVPFRQLVLKVHSRCDLACDHCYVYEHQDQSWRNRPKVMSRETVAWTAARLAEHAKAHGLAEVRVPLHGGEPLLAGPERLREIARTLRDGLSGLCDLDLRIHTNGVLLDEAYCRVFAEEGVLVGVSVDGYAKAHDRHRRYANGPGSYRQVVRAVELLRTAPYRHLYAGLLCTIDLANDPVAVYEALVALDPPRIEFLLPHATWDHPPYRPPGGDAAYADWLLAVFRRWRADGRPVPIRLFDSVISTTLGGASRTEAVELEPSDLVVVETDGTYEQADSLKTAFDGAPPTGFEVVQHDLDQVAGHPGIGARQRGLVGLCGTCRACPVVASCGGGLYAHRYRSASGFANPSVFCADLKKLITEVRQAIWPQAAAGLTAIMPLTAGDAGREVSAAARHAFGAVAAALPADYAYLALFLIHEFQHVKLGVLDMFDLFDPDDHRLCQVAWREDPRPLEGVLQGTYAQVAVTDFWRTHRHIAEGPAARAAHAQFARWRAATAAALETWPAAAPVLIREVKNAPKGSQPAPNCGAKRVHWRHCH